MGRRVLHEGFDVADRLARAMEVLDEGDAHMVVAVFAEPDIMLVDEVLAVGDKGFQNKCFNRMGELLDTAESIGLVTKSGAWYTHGDTRIGQGRERAIDYLQIRNLQ